MMVLEIGRREEQSSRDNSNKSNSIPCPILFGSGTEDHDLSTRLVGAAFAFRLRKVE